MFSARFRERVDTALTAARRPGPGRRASLKELCNICDAGANGYQREQLKLIRALAARALIKERLSLEEEFGHYKTLFFGFSLADASDLPQTLTASAAALLYERGEYGAASQLFSSLGDSDPRLTILRAYCNEGLGKASQDVGVITEGLNLIDSLQRHRGSNGDPRFAAERHHCAGHLLLARASIGKEGRVADRQLAIANLRQASEVFPGYLSCYTSSFAEIGDYGLAIERSREVLRRSRESFSNLEQSQVETVMAEVKFYLAYALSCTNDYREAEGLFREFANSMNDLGRRDAYDHAQLFLIKTQLKRLRLSEANAPQIAALREALSQLRFSHWVRSAIGREQRHYELALGFLTGLGELLSSNDARVLERVADHGLRIIEDLGEPLKDLLQFPLVTLLSGDNALHKNLLDRVERAGVRQDLLQHVQIAEVQSTGRPEISGDFIVISARNLGEVTGVVSYLSANRFVIAYVSNQVQQRAMWPRIRYAETTSVDTAFHYMVIGLTIALIKRFLVEDEYVFALAPCEDSPALEFQRPDRYLGLPEALV